MSEFESLGLKGGVWSGKLWRKEPPARIVLVHMGELVAEARSTASDDDSWQIEVAVPSDRLSDGVQTFLLLGDNGEEPVPGERAETLAQLSIVAGQPLEMDLRAEIDLLRAELDLVKRELRRLATQTD